MININTDTCHLQTRTKSWETRLTADRLRNKVSRAAVVEQHTRNTVGSKTCREVVNYFRLVWRAKLLTLPVDTMAGLAMAGVSWNSVLCGFLLLYSFNSGMCINYLESLIRYLDFCHWTYLYLPTTYRIHRCVVMASWHWNNDALSSNISL